MQCLELDFLIKHLLVFFMSTTNSQNLSASLVSMTNDQNLISDRHQQTKHIIDISTVEFLIEK